MILPVVGLLLLLGLFWYWASSLIGDDDDDPSATPSQVAIVVTEAAPSPTPTEEAAITPEETTQAGDEETTGDGGESTDEETAPDDEEGGEDTGDRFQQGDIVTLTEDGVRVRSEPSVDGAIEAELETGDELRITGPPEQGGDFLWWPVEYEAESIVGWVADGEWIE